MPTRKPRGAYAKTPARRQEIVDAAVEVFSSSGFHKGSLRDVAERVGLSQAGLLHHFPSKEHLLQAVLTWRDDQAAAWLGDPLPEGVDLLHGMVKLVELHVILSAEGTSADHPLRTYFIERYATGFRLIRDAFRTAEARGQVKPGVDGDVAARTVIALMDGLQVQWLLHRDDVDMAGDLRVYIQSLLAVEL